ncbi:MAG TPA: DUF3352 domain-containing protein [Candidatus Limnocylindria bacterium]|nr:DUF3352 domain-containing protein [Candidatus Limnocylindria bacterium]
MHRLVIGLTTLLALIGAVVVVAYLFIFGAGVDRAAGLAPADTQVYASVYLSPSVDQQRNIGSVLGKLPGFADLSNLPAKIDELAQRALGSTGIDYSRDVAPWLGDEVAVAVRSPTSAQPLLIAAVRGESAARAALARVAAQEGATTSSETYQGVAITTFAGKSGGEGGAFAIVDQMLVASADHATLLAAIDAAVGRSTSLADVAAFRSAMASLPADRLASIYLDLAGAARATGQSAQASGFSTVGLALVVRPDGLQLAGRAPINPSAVSASERANLALGTEQASLSEWMPEDSQAELTFFGARQTFDTVVAQLGSAPGGEQIASSLTQLRALAALGLGIDLDRDLLPLFDREAAIAITGLDASTPRGELLLRPSDATAATSALDRIVASLRGRGASVTTAQAAGTTITSVDVPSVGALSFAISDGVIVAGLTADDVRAALEAHASGKTLAATSAYTDAFSRAGGRSGNELYVDGSQVANLIGGLVNVPTDARDMLTHLGALALAVPTHDNQIEIHGTVTVH